MYIFPFAKIPIEATISLYTAAVFRFPFSFLFSKVMMSYEKTPLSCVELLEPLVSYSCILTISALVIQLSVLKYLGANCNVHGFNLLYACMIVCVT